MIDLTPLDVRKKRGDFGKSLRGYETQEVDSFLDLVAERMEELVKETLTLRERAERLQVQVDSQTGREQAVQEALVTAQSLRGEIREQARREADLARREAGVEASRILADAQRQVEERVTVLGELERKRTRFLRALRSLLERELDVVAVEEGRTSLDEVPIDLELSGGGGSGAEEVEGEREAGDEAAGEPAAEPVPEGKTREVGTGSAAPEADGRVRSAAGPPAVAPDPGSELWLSGLGEEAEAEDREGEGWSG